MTTNAPVPVYGPLSFGQTTAWDGTRWVASTPVASNVVMWRADTTGATDSYPALQAALNALAGTGSALMIPAGTYLVNTLPTIPAGTLLSIGTGVTFTGAGATALSQLGGQTYVQTGTTSAPGAVQALSILPVDTTEVPFSLAVQSAKFNSTWDTLALFGWNATRANTSAPVVRWNNERDYEVSPGTHWSEAYLEMWPTGQASFFRPIYFNLFQATGEGQSILAHGLGNTANDLISITNGEGSVTYAAFGPASSAANGVTLGASSLPLNVNSTTTTLSTGVTTWNSSSTFTFSSTASSVELNAATTCYVLGSTITFGTTNLGATAAQISSSAGIFYTAYKLGGYGVPLQFAANSGSTLSHGGTTNVSAGSAECRDIAYTDSGLTTNATIVFPTTTGPTEWILDLSGVTLGGHTIGVQVGSATKTVTGLSNSVYLLRSDGVGKMWALTFT